MPVRLNAIERLVWLRFNRAPGPLLDLFGAGGFRAVSLGLKLGLFDALADDPRTPAELARQLDLDARGLEVLLGLLEPLGYVSRSNEVYEVTPMTRAWLAPGSRTDIGPWLRFWDELAFPYWDRVFEQAVREGQPPTTIYEWFDEEPARWETAQRGFLAVARLMAPEVVARVSIPAGASTLLDVGGGHGHFSRVLCNEYPGLSATVFDTPAVEPIVRETATAAGLGDRLTFTAGDYLADALPDCDVALVFNVVHAHTPAENRELFDRVGAALAPGGRLVVLDQFDESSRFSTVETALGFVALTYFVTLGGRIYTPAEVERWLREAGFARVRRRPLRRTPGVGLLEADVGTSA